MAEPVSVIIKAAGWEGYTGPLGLYLFKDGKSVEKIPIRAALRIGASIEAYDENGIRLHPSTYVTHSSPSSIPAQSINYPVGEQDSVPAYVPETKTVETTISVDTTPAKEIIDGVLRETYTRIQLEAIADKRGIDGLRSIADQRGVKGRSVVELIDKILGAQV